jgi:cell volume regulation protein A
MNVEIFFIIGFTIFVGYLSSLFSERTRISEVLLLILFGFLLGPVFGFVDTSSTSIIVEILPIVSTLALIVLLFDGGIEFNLRSVAKAIPRSTAYAIIVFAISIVFTTLFMSGIFGWSMIMGVLLGAVIGGTSSAIVIAMAEHLDIQRDTKARLTVESTITDALSIIVAIVVLRMILESATLSVGALVNTMLGSFTIAIFLGAFSAFSWILISHRFLLNKFNYMLTLALVFGLYSVTEAVNANGGIAVFVFGIVLGNAKHLIGILRMRIEKPVDPKIKVFQDEVTFFVRTFFFVYIGLLLTPEHFTGLVVLVSVALLGLLIIARWITTRIVLPDLPRFDTKIVMSMMPRGLAAAVLATFPLSAGLVIQDFQQIVFAIILLTNLTATAGIFIFRERPEKEEEQLKHTLEEAEKEAQEAKKKRAKAKEELKKMEKEEKVEAKKAKKENGKKVR